MVGCLRRLLVERTGVCFDLALGGRGRAVQWLAELGGTPRLAGLRSGSLTLWALMCIISTAHRAHHGNHHR